MKVKHPITEYTKEREETESQKEPYLVVNSFIYRNDNFLSQVTNITSRSREPNLDPSGIIIQVRSHIKDEVNKSSKYVMFLIVFTNHFPVDEGWDSMANLFKEVKDGVILDCQNFYCKDFYRSQPKQNRPRSFREGLKPKKTHSDVGNHGIRRKAHSWLNLRRSKGLMAKEITF